MKRNILLLCLVLAASFAMLSLSSCSVVVAGKYSGPYSELNGEYAGVDDLGRVLTLDSKQPDNEKTVGIFYFLWQGEHGTDGPYDNEKIVLANPEAVISEANWLLDGGGNVGAHHFWGEPLFGYYTSRDKWVYAKHVQMLTDAGVDFIMFDATNGFPYLNRVQDLISVWYDYYEQGFDVPKLCFYTNANSAAVMMELYTNLYKGTSAFFSDYPNLDELWFKWDGKPLIVGTSQVSSSLRNYFTIKESQWPNAAKKINGFPWMEFDRLLTTDAVYGSTRKRKEVINVSIAQHNKTITFSQTAWYDGNDRTRSWHNGKNDTSADALLYGYNFQEQWDFAIAQNTEMIFVTGWNEWVAQRQPARFGIPIVFVDCADPNTSRDAEPTAGEMGDNYYMQLADNIRSYKGSKYRVNVGGNTTIDTDGDFSQWESPRITAKYLDYTGDTQDRYCAGFGSTVYEDESGRNDFCNIKTAKDSRCIYFYADTSDNIVIDDNPMILYLVSGIAGNKTWEGYDYRVKINEGAAFLEKYSGSSWEAVDEVSCKISDNKIMLAVERGDLGVQTSVNDDVLNIQFKWTDNCEEDIWSFYKNGDAAPLGRMNYVFSEKE